MIRAQKTAYRLRHVILIAGILFTIAGIVWAILPLLFDADDFAGLLGTVLIWAFGPGIVLLYMREKRRIEKLKAFEQN
jgi:hypothetical protein